MLLLELKNLSQQSAKMMGDKVVAYGFHLQYQEPLALICQNTNLKSELK